MKTKYYIILAILICIILFIVFCWEWIIVLFPSQEFEIHNANYILLVEILLEPSDFNENTIFNQPSFIWTIINAIILGGYLMAIGLTTSMSKRNWLIIFAIVLILLIVIGMFSIRITINLPFLIYKSIQTNTSEAQLFFTSNLLFVLLPIFLISHITEAEIK